MLKITIIMVNYSIRTGFVYPIDICTYTNHCQQYLLPREYLFESAAISTIKLLPRFIALDDIGNKLFIRQIRPSKLPNSK